MSKKLKGEPFGYFVVIHLISLEEVFYPNDNINDNFYSLHLRNFTRENC